MPNSNIENPNFQSPIYIDPIAQYKPDVIPSVRKGFTLRNKLGLTVAGVMGVLGSVYAPDAQAQPPTPTPSGSGEDTTSLVSDTLTQTTENGPQLISSMFSPDWPKDEEGNLLETNLEKLYEKLEITSLRAVEANAPLADILGSQYNHAFNLGFVGLETFEETTSVDISGTEHKFVGKFAYLYFAFNLGDGNGGVMKLRVNDRLALSTNGKDTELIKVDELSQKFKLRTVYKGIFGLNPSGSEESIGRTCSRATDQVNCRYFLDTAVSDTPITSSEYLNKLQGSSNDSGDVKDFTQGMVIYDISFVGRER